MAQYNKNIVPVVTVFDTVHLYPHNSGEMSGTHTLFFLYVQTEEMIFMLA